VVAARDQKKRWRRTGFAAKFEGRMAEAEADVRAAIVSGDSRGALHLARAAYGSEASKLRDRLPDAGAVRDVETAAQLLALAEQLVAYKPERFADRRPVPPPQQLLAAFDLALAEARAHAQPGGRP